MPIDNSIYFQQQTPDILGNAQRGLSMRDMLTQQKMQQDALEKQRAIDQAYSAGVTRNADGTVGYDGSKTLSALAGVKGAGKDVAAAYDANRAREVADLEAKRKKHLDNMTNFSQLFGGVKDQASYDYAMSQAPSYGLNLSSMPQVYDPNLVKQRLSMAMSYKDQLEQQNKQREFDVTKSKADSEIAKNRAETKKLEAETNQKNQGAGAGFKKVDEDYAKDYNDFTGGGLTKAQDAISKLKNWRDKVVEESKKTFQNGGGPIAGSMPDALRSEKSIAIRDNVISVANSALKATFGGQLSDGERHALAMEFYNDKLSPKENIEVMNRKIAELEHGFGVAKAKAQYFQKNRTLNGFDGASTAASTYAASDKPAWAK